MKIDFAALKFNVHGYINAIVQDAGTDEVLALAKMDGEALARTAENGSLWLYDPEKQKRPITPQKTASFFGYGNYCRQKRYGASGKSAAGAQRAGRIYAAGMAKRQPARA